MKTKKVNEINPIAELQVSYNPEKTGVIIKEPGQAHAFLMKVWDLQLLNLTEQVYVLFLDNKNEIITWKLVNTGNQTGCDVNIKLILSLALQCMACSIIIAHNHPSGQLIESPRDTESHSNLKTACKLLYQTG